MNSDTISTLKYMVEDWTKDLIPGDSSICFLSKYKLSYEQLFCKQSIYLNLGISLYSYNFPSGEKYLCCSKLNSGITLARIHQNGIIQYDCSAIPMILQAIVKFDWQKNNFIMEYFD